MELASPERSSGSGRHSQMVFYMYKRPYSAGKRLRVLQTGMLHGKG